MALFLPFLSSVFFLSDDVIRRAAKSPVVHIYPKGILTPCYHSTCRAATTASSLHDILLPRRRQKNKVQRQRMERERGKQCLVCAYEREAGWGAVSHFHLRGTHLAFTQWPGGIWRPFTYLFFISHLNIALSLSKPTHVLGSHKNLEINKLNM